MGRPSCVCVRRPCGQRPLTLPGGAVPLRSVILNSTLNTFLVLLKNIPGSLFGSW